MRSSGGLPFSIFKDRHGFGGAETEVLSFNFLFCFLEGKNPHRHRHNVGAGVHAGKPFVRSLIWLPTGPALISLDKLTHTPSNFLVTIKVRSVELIVDT